MKSWALGGAVISVAVAMGGVRAGLGAEQRVALHPGDRIHHQFRRGAAHPLGRGQRLRQHLQR